MKNPFLFGILVASTCLSSCGHKTIKVTSSSAKTTSVSKTTVPKQATKSIKPAPAEVVVSEEIIDARVAFIKGDNLDAALAKAKAEKKAVFLDFYADWCAPCKILDDSVFHDYDIADFMNQNIINLKINVEKGNGASIKQKLYVSVLPTLLFLDPDGNEIARKEGAPLIADFKKMMKTAAWKAKNGSGQP